MAVELEGTDQIHYRDGLDAFTSPKGIRVLVLRLGADPADTPEWIAEARKPYTQKDWRREMEGDWSTPAGDPYFPIFSQVGRDRYVHLATKLIRGPVFRAYDFGRRRPAAIWFQYDAKQDRAWLLREFMPPDLLTHQFRDAVRYLSGQLPYEALHESAQRRVDEYAGKRTGEHCPPPWFPPGAVQFIDIGGKEANQTQSNVIMQEDAVVADIFAAVGMPLTIVSPSVLGRNRVVDRMLQVREDGWPGLFLDPQMEETIAGFEGAFSYPAPSKANPVPTKPRDDGHFINILDAVGYGIVAVCPAEMAPKDTGGLEKVQRVIDGRVQDPVFRKRVRDAEEVGWAETRLGGRR